MDNIKNGKGLHFDQFEEDTIVKARTRSEEAILKMNIGSLVFDKEELKRLKDVMLRYYIDLKNLYAYYSSLSTDYPCLNYDDVYQILVGNTLEDEEQHE